jgi:type I restriction enzyme R subunit
VQAENHARTDARAACFYARLALETIVNWLYRAERSLRDPYERTLAWMSKYSTGRCARL